MTLGAADFAGLDFGALGFGKAPGITRQANSGLRR